MPGTGTTTVCRILSERYGLEHIYAGKIFRTIAEERGLTLEELNLIAEEDPSIDSLLDERQLDMALQRRDDGVILEGRVSGYMLNGPLESGGLTEEEVFRVWLVADLDERGRRLSGREGKALIEVIPDIEERERSERARYVTIYGFDPMDSDLFDILYDIVIDTTTVPAKKVAGMIAEMVDAGKEGGK